MDRQALRAFALRDWTAAEHNKRQYWVDQYRRYGSEPARRASTSLLEHARRLGSVPNSIERADDLAHHVEVRDRLDRAARALARR